MGTWISDSLRTGAVASAATTASAAVLGHVECGAAAAPLNAVSHMVWGDEATRTDAVDVRHTAVGAGLNAAAVTSWAAMHELLMPREGRPDAGRALAGGAITALVAYITDYHVVPKRFTPGFEHRLSPKGLFGIYAVLALSLAVGSLSRPDRA